MIDMIARKAMPYKTRRLLPGDPFVASRQDARALNAIGKARYATRDMIAEDRPTRTPRPSAPEDIAALRAAYQTKFDKRPFNGWSTETLREKLAAG